MADTDKALESLNKDKVKLKLIRSTLQEIGKKLSNAKSITSHKNHIPLRPFF